MLFSEKSPEFNEEDILTIDRSGVPDLNKFLILREALTLLIKPVWLVGIYYVSFESLPAGTVGEESPQQKKINVSEKFFSFT
jgi:hypothetical protein